MRVSCSSPPPLSSAQLMVEMTNKGIAPNPIVIDGIVDGFVRSGDIGEAISFAQHSFNQVGVLFVSCCRNAKDVW